MKKIVAIGYDGTNVNTGCDGKVIRLFEVHCNKFLHWFVWFLHMNKLTFRHLPVYLDRGTRGPNSFSGPIRKAIASCSNPVVQYEPKQGNTRTHINPDDLSNDQRYLYKMNQAILSGQCPSDLAGCQPGPMSHAQWLTTTSRILHLYISIDHPSTILRTLVTYIVQIYPPVWFEIKPKQTILC